MRSLISLGTHSATRLCYETPRSSLKSLILYKTARRGSFSPPRGFGADEGTCAFGGAPRRTAHRAVRFAFGLCSFRTLCANRSLPLTSPPSSPFVYLLLKPRGEEVFPRRAVLVRTKGLEPPWSPTGT